VEIPRTPALVFALVVLAACQGTGVAAQSRASDAAARAGTMAADETRGAAHEPRGDLSTETMRRRMALAERLGPGVVWIETPTGTDLERFYQEDNFYYLTGVEIPDVALALLVDDNGSLVDEVLFLPPYDANFEVWNGKRLAPGAEAEALTGFRRTEPIGSRDEVLSKWEPSVIHAYPKVSADVPDGADVNTTRARSELSKMRLVKSPYEVDCLTRAIDITAAALHEAIAEVKPGNYEYQPQGALEGTFLKLGAERPGFASIFGSGPNSVTLHYNSNRRQMQDGDLIVMDVGAKFRYYCADITRTVPVNGRFTDRQREIYELVLAAQTAAAEAARPGMTIGDLDAISRKVISDAGYARAFKHGVGHWIGLDVHDVGGRAPIEVNTLFTIEPGIYLEDENLGVRIEDDYLMTPSGAVKLSDGVPSDPDELEALLANS
jgi:Xaa-Pro aminopeptidase